MKIVLLTMLTCAVVLGQSKDELKAKYGSPVSETFIVRPGIEVTATHAATGRIVELVISPQNTGLIKSKSSTGKSLTNDLLRTIVDELVPMPNRGKYLIGTFMDFTCLPHDDCAGSEEDYERLTIYYNAADGDGSNYAVIQWKP
jgi:hypothetical protein